VLLDVVAAVVHRDDDHTVGRAGFWGGGPPRSSSLHRCRRLRR